jgi:basic membrane protein A and related proteins
MPALLPGGEAPQRQRGRHDKNIGQSSPFGKGASEAAAIAAASGAMAEMKAGSPIFVGPL